MRVLVTGGSGTLGRSCVRLALAAGHQVHATSRRTPPPVGGLSWLAADITQRGAVDALMKRVGPDVVVHTAFRQDDWRTVVAGSVNVAQAAKAVAARVVLISTDAVFSSRSEPYGEDEDPSPVTPCGAAKAAAEASLAAIEPRTAIVRTSLIIGDHGQTGHERQVHQVVANPASGAFFTDEIRCPVHVDDLASAVLEIATNAESHGVHHVAGPDAISRHELAQLIAERDGLDPSRVPSALRRESGLAGAPVVILDCTRTLEGLRTRPRGARAFLRRQDRTER